MISIYALGIDLLFSWIVHLMSEVNRAAITYFLVKDQKIPRLKRTNSNFVIKLELEPLSLDC